MSLRTHMDYNGTIVKNLADTDIMSLRTHMDYNMI